MEKHGRNSPRSLSPATEEDFSAIAAEAMKWADVKVVMSSRSKTIDGTKAGKKDVSVPGEQGCEEDRDWVYSLTTPYVFEPKKIPEKSNLSELMDVNGAGGKRFMSLKVFHPFGKTSKPTPIPVKVLENANATDVIKTSLKVLKETYKVNPNPDVYKLRVAEDDSGNPDEDLPVLDKKTGLRRMGFDALVLCFATSGLRETTTKTLEDLMYTIICGSGRTRGRRVSLPPDVVFKDAAALVCEKFKKDPSRHVLKVVLDGTEKDTFGENHIPFADRTLGALHSEYGIRDFYLRPKGKDVDDIESDGELEAPSSTKTKLFRDWDEASAYRYSEYTVIKINKFGLRQHRVLGIDREKIYNMMAGHKVQKTKNPERSIGDIIYIRTFLDKPCYIEIEYRNNKSGRDQIECQSPIEAHEIATKVSFLLELHRRNSGVVTQPVEKKLPIASGMDKV